MSYTQDSAYSTPQNIYFKEVELAAQMLCQHVPEHHLYGPHNLFQVLYIPVSLSKGAYIFSIGGGVACPPQSCWNPLKDFTSDSKQNYTQKPDLFSSPHKVTVKLNVIT